VRSPFTFFRRHRKLMLACLGVLAMFGFVILPVIMQGLGSGPVSNPLVAETRFGEIRESTLVDLTRQRGTVVRFLMFLAEAIQQAGGDPRVVQSVLNQIGGTSEEAVVERWLLSRYAERLGLEVDNRAINYFIGDLTQGYVTADTVRGILAQLGVSEDSLFRALREELLALRAMDQFSLSLASFTPAQRWDYFQRFNRMVTIESVELPVERFISQVQESPSEKELRELFDAHRLQVDDPDSPDLGFAEPKQVALEYLVAPFDKFVDLGAVTDEEVERFYNEQKDRLYRRESLPTMPPTKPETVSPGPAAAAPASPSSPSPPATEQPSDAGQSPTGETADNPVGTSTAVPSYDQLPSSGLPATPVIPPSTNQTDTAAPQSDVSTTSQPGSASTPQLDSSSSGNKAPSSSEETSGEQALQSLSVEQSQEKGTAGEPASETPLPSERQQPTSSEGPGATGSAQWPPMNSRIRSHSPNRNPLIHLAVFQPEEKVAGTAAQNPNSEAATLGGGSISSSSGNPSSDNAINPSGTGGAESPGGSEVPSQTGEAPRQNPSPGTAADSPGTSATPVPEGGAAASVVSYIPLEEVKDEIRRTLARRKAPEKIRDLLGQLESQLSRYREDKILYDLSVQNRQARNRTEPIRPDLAALGKQHALDYRQLGLSSIFEVAKLDIGSATTLAGASVLEAVFERLPVFRPAVAQDPQQNFYLIWKTEEKESRIPDFSEPQTREKVLVAWKTLRARQLALQEANRLAEMARQKGTKLAEALAGQAGLTVVESQPFSWLTSGALPPFWMQAPPRISEVKGVDRPGHEFMRTVFSLSPGQIAVAMNHPQTAAYVIRLLESNPSPEVLWEQMLKQPFIFYVGAARQDQAEMYQQWLEEIKADFSFRWDPEWQRRMWERPRRYTD